jgi:hypothetical protein
MLRGRALPQKFEKFHNWAKPSPRYNRVIIHRTITGILLVLNLVLNYYLGIDLSTVELSGTELRTFPPLVLGGIIENQNSDFVMT